MKLKEHIKHKPELYQEILKFIRTLNRENLKLTMGLISYNSDDFALVDTCITGDLRDYVSFLVEHEAILEYENNELIGIATYIKSKELPFVIEPVTYITAFIVRTDKVTTSIIEKIYTKIYNNSHEKMVKKIWCKTINSNNLPWISKVEVIDVNATKNDITILETYVQLELS